MHGAWIAFANEPSKAHDLLISPYKTRAAGPVAALLARRLRPLRPAKAAQAASHVAYLQGLVAARLHFRELLQVVVPMTGWWLDHDRRIEHDLRLFTEETMTARLAAILRWARSRDVDRKALHAKEFASFATLDRYTTLAGLISGPAHAPERHPVGLARHGAACVADLAQPAGHAGAGVVRRCGQG